ncbi:MFS transporter [Hymenobacter sp. HMF4947]|uniref:MFS transporter n=1 Tax=Hymenobacter ginkgonis TaxID=2682976 RepID=A0A7K1TB92_9BACT|nr:MFS transporter [Hymenobacter ginkgonis]MVN75678.1 MFS transporter [Hymenobacter ginkgonis]
MSQALPAPAPALPAAPAATSPTHPWGLLLVILTAPLLSVLDVFIVNMAIPAIRTDLGATGADLELVIAGYLLGFSAFLITGGRAGDQYGRRRVFITGLVLFTLTSCLCGIAPSIGQLVLYRFLQGVSAAFMLPQTIALIQVSFAEAQARNRAFGYYGITLGIASMLGLYLGGYLVSTNWGVAGWRLTFLVNLPVGVVATGAALRLLPETARNHAQQFDFGGVALLTAGLGAVVYPLSVGREVGWPAWSLALLLLGLALLGVLLRQQASLLRRGGNPLLDVDLFGYPSFNLGVGTLVFFFSVHNSFLLISTVYLQSGLHVPSYAAGTTFVFFGAGFLVSAYLSIRYIGRFGKRLLQFGLLLMLLALAGQVLRAPAFATSLAELKAWLLLYGLGSGLVIPSLLNVALRCLPARFAGGAAGVYSTFQQVASALGVTLIGGVFFAHWHPGEAASFVRAFRFGLGLDIGCLLVAALLLEQLQETKAD